MDPDHHALVSDHRRAVVVPVRVLPRDRPVDGDQQVERFGLVDDLGNPLAGED